ncbi:MAG: AbrB/MazE/SpoVT family DNA-binding domain-containing protein [archaeon GB-1867-035]|nr:AbrB/MazE/SpoVT family DNA-binding domain-containing protein [Candidatus Culexmicrobium profundum]
MEFKTKISVKGQIVIPKEIREKYGFKKEWKLSSNP